MVVLALVCLGTAQAQGRIAFITLNGQVATVNPDGSEPRVLSAGAQQFQFPAWSPEGGSLAVLGSDSSGGFVQVLADEVDAQPNELYRSATEGPFYLYWSPDSAQVSFLANRAEGGLGMHVVPVEDVPVGESLVATGNPFYWQWTADAERMFIHTGFTGERSRLGFINSDEDTLEENLAPPGRFQAPGLSPSGRYVAYAANTPGRGSEVVIQTVPGSDEELTREASHAGFAALSWSPVRDELAFMSPDTEAQAAFGPIKLLDAETGLLETLTERRAVAFFWSPDGNTIAFFTPARSGGGDVAETGTLQKINQRSMNQQPVNQQGVLLDLYAIDVAERTEELVATFTPTPVFTGQFLPFFDQYALSHSVWSPDSDALVLPVVDTESRTFRVAVISLDGTVTPVGEGDMPFWGR